MCWFTSTFGAWVVRRGIAGDRGALWGLRVLVIPRDAGARGPHGLRADGGPVTQRSWGSRPAS